MAPIEQLRWACALLLAALPAASTGGGEIFVDVTAESGVDFRHQDGRSGEKFYVETTASGGGWLDADGDGDLDLYLINGAATPGARLTGTPRNALYENRRRADGSRFVDVTASAGVGDTGYGMGMCAGDFDGDGRLDFLLTNYGPDRLYRNLGPDAGGGARFAEVAQRAGVADRRWSSSCAFGDLDGDGDLDLYVTHYVDFAFDRNPVCGGRGAEKRRYCRPNAFDGVPDALFENRGDGTFTERGAERGIAQTSAEKGMGMVLSDLDGDGDLDIYVANDGAVNRLYVNDGGGRFEDQGLLSGAGLDAFGAPEAGMGVDAGDLDGDGRPDLIVTHFAMETHTLYRQLGRLSFEDVTARSGLGPPSFRQVGWGAQLVDVDLDGDLDLAVANGHMQEGVEKIEPGLRYRQPNQLFENDGRGRFRLLAGAAWRQAAVSRGLAVGDWNDDGRPDLLITNTNDPPQLLENRLQGKRRWLGLVLVGPPENRFAIGARVELVAGGRRQLREVRSGGGFQSQSDLRLLFGLGDLPADTEPASIQLQVRWPDGELQKLSGGPLDRYRTVRHRRAR